VSADSAYLGCTISHPAGVRGLAAASFWIVGLSQSRRRPRNRDNSRNCKRIDNSAVKKVRRETHPRAALPRLCQCERQCEHQAGGDGGGLGQGRDRTRPIPSRPPPTRSIASVSWEGPKPSLPGTIAPLPQKAVDRSRAPCRPSTVWLIWRLVPAGLSDLEAPEANPRRNGFRALTRARSFPRFPLAHRRYDYLIERLFYCGF
jgi:hypothetical protein